MTLLENDRSTLGTALRTAERAAGPVIDRSGRWVDVCAFDELVPDVGVAALVDGDAVAVFRCWPNDDLHAVANVDPFSGASVISRGIVGSVGERAVVASPIFKQRFDLETGVSVEDESVSVAVYEVSVVEGRVLVAASATGTHGGVTTRKRHGNNVSSP
jgi:nitrite reductase (NADH) small subunit